MKSLVLFILLTAVASCNCASAEERQPREWKIRLTVLDDAGTPVTNARVAVAYFIRGKAGLEPESERLTGVTGGFGVFEARHVDTGSQTLGLQIEKDGYYAVGITYSLAGKYS